MQDPNNLISEILPHRAPFLFVSKIDDIDFNNKEIKTCYNSTTDDVIYQGHFPDRPVFPGVIQLEAAAQAAGLYLGLDYLQQHNLTKVDNRPLGVLVSAEIKLLKIITPPATLNITAKLIASKHGIHLFSANIRCDESRCFRGKLGLSLIDDNKNTLG